MWLKGFAADEMNAAYARASQFAGPADDAAARFVAYYGECLRGFMRGEYRQAHAAAEAFLREAKAEGRAMEAGVARRVLGFVSLQLGDLQAARNVLERALSDYVRERDQETLFRFGNDTQVSATNFLALTEWHLGELEQARSSSTKSNRRARRTRPCRGDRERALLQDHYRKPPRRRARHAGRRWNRCLQLTEERNLKTYADLGRMYSNWARGKLHDPQAGAVGLKEALASYLALGNRSGAPSFHGLLAELEAMRPDLDGALATIDAGLAMAEETGEHCDRPLSLPAPRRIPADALRPRPGRGRGGVPRRDLDRQGAGRAGLRALAAHALARLYRSTGRPDDGASHPRARARGLFADAGNARDRRGQGAVAQPRLNGRRRRNRRRPRASR